jgi:NitT/TauT family transport system substrate-binding protein
MSGYFRGAFWAALFFGLTGATANAADPVKLVISYPGPRNISYLPLDLAPRIGADKAEGAALVSLTTGGGAVALGNLLNRNADFAIAGLPAAMSQRVSGGKVVAVAPVDDAPLFILMARSDLKGKIKRIADLKGRVIGVNTSSLTSKTTSQQLVELVLLSDGVKPDQVRIVPAGQSWREQSTLLEGKLADAIMGDEPFASRLKAEGKVFFLANLADPATSRRIAGANFLHAALETRDDMIAQHPEEVARMVRILKRTLDWMAKHTPAQIVDALGVSDAEERQSLLHSLKTYPNLYSKDGRFSTRQLAETETFFRASSGDTGPAAALRLESMVVDTWAGRKP